MVSPLARQLWLDSAPDLFNQLKTSSLQLVGLGHATQIRNEGWWFCEVGRFIERADKTSRILDLRHHTLPPRGVPRAVNQTDTLEWAAVLRSCSGWDAYKSIYGAEVQPRHVAEFLLLNKDFPRSIRFCVEQLDNALRQISGVAGRSFSNEAENFAGGSSRSCSSRPSRRFLNMACTITSTSYNSNSIAWATRFFRFTSSRHTRLTARPISCNRRSSGNREYTLAAERPFC